MWLLSLQLLSHSVMRAPPKTFTVPHQIDSCVSQGPDLSLGLLAKFIAVDGISRHFLRAETRAGASYPAQRLSTAFEDTPGLLYIFLGRCTASIPMHTVAEPAESHQQQAIPHTIFQYLHAHHGTHMPVHGH